VLVVCGSWVPASTRQLAALTGAHPDSLVEVNVRALASESAGGEIARAAREAGRLLAGHRLAVVATERERHEDVAGFELQQRVAANLAAVVRAVEPLPAVVVAKGGITSHVTAREGLGARRGLVLGPLADGIALWRLEGQRGPVPYVVFPGNVGDDRTLLEVADAILAA
jgi:uncharacterized protein YgbK (DUF1537 family)